MGTTTEKKITVPWVDQQPFLKTGWAEAQRLLAKGMPAYYGGQTVARLSAEQKLANRGIMGYTRGGAVRTMNRQAQRQLGRGYDQSQTLFNRGLTAGTSARTDALRRAREIGGYGTDQMGYGAQASKYGLSQGDYAGMTPFQSQQLSDMLAGKVNTGQLRAVTSAMGRDVMDTLSAPGGMLSQIRGQQVRFQPGGSSRGDIVTGMAAKGAAQKLADQSSRMYADAFSAAQQRRLPAGQMALGAQQQAQQLGLQGGQMGLSAGQLGLSALSQYPTIMQAPLSAYGAMAGVGAQQRALSQADINAAMKKYEYGAMGDRTALAGYMPMISGDYGSASTAKPSGLQNLGNLAKLLGGLGGMFGGTS